MFGNFCLFKTPFLGQSSVPPSFVSFFVFYIFSYLLLKTMGCFSGCLMSSAGIQKLFCGIYSVFKCSFDEFVGEKVFSPSYSSAILAPPPPHCLMGCQMVLESRLLTLESGWTKLLSYLDSATELFTGSSGTPLHSAAP